MNAVQNAAYEMIQEDARFLYSLTKINQKAKHINSNYIMMSLPYIGLFADGAEQWYKKVGLDSPKFNKAEKEFYSKLRQSNKLFELSYLDYSSMLINKLNESDNYFYSIRSFLEKLIGYYNVGTDLYKGHFCGNTILTALYAPFDLLYDDHIGKLLYELAIVAGELASFSCGENISSYAFKDITVRYKDYHFYNNCPLKYKSDADFVLFSIICSVNYVIEFLENYFVDEIPQKFKFAYIQYYYLCGFIKEFNEVNGTNYYINNSMKNRDFRNCIVHYGLGQYLTEDELFDDTLKGLTQKAFELDYTEAKKQLYSYLKELVKQIESNIF